MELNHLPAAPLNNGYRVTAGNGEQDPNCVVETTGVEPVVPFGRRIYSPLGLPIFLHLQFGGSKENRTPINGVTSHRTDHYTMKPNLVVGTGIEPVLLT